MHNQLKREGTVDKTAGKAKDVVDKAAEKAKGLVRTTDDAAR